ncbi:DUF4924 family protein [Geofilum rubicundum]|uniref:DUF4924 domain-containing protein n=1 Tax=Geofilum rubicundum JCM 15548 TaxID=1236989 RepID=A0A0E9M0T0_9BACT|nr:DUF4924 family protein [Geofilum rubicundum]GAO31104.1 hypothetical protein JCM15548_13440 [Geofilum rubicundum JCM 15548]
MLIAQEKKKNNIAEYILYMWQVEDLIRAHECRMDLIREKLLPGYLLSGEQFKELDAWWDNLTAMMKVEKKESGGHLQMLINTVNEMNTLHLKLLESPKFVPYLMQFQSILPFIKELEAKTDPKPSNDIELMLSALYHSFVLKLKKQPVTSDTAQALKAFAQVLATLSKKYKEEQEGKLDFED